MSENMINQNFNTKTENSIIVTCPHCNLLIFIFEKEYNCKIFRHGVYKNNISQQIDPHLSKEECDRLKKEDRIFGCGKPFKLMNNAIGKPTAVICDYIQRKQE